MINIVLVEPQIPPNTGNIIRLAANTGFDMHLVKPLGFAMDDKRLRRAGLDYEEWAQLKIHANWQDLLANEQPQRLFAISTKGQSRYTDVQFKKGDFVVFGSETRGLCQSILESDDINKVLRIPMQAHSRSMNLANAAAVIIYEAWRQLDFSGSV